MAEPPAKRPRREDQDYTTLPRSPYDHKSTSRRTDDRDDRNGYTKDNDRNRRRSRSPARRDRSRERDRSYRERDRDRDRFRDRNSDRSRREEGKNYKPRKHSRSRSRTPPRNGTGPNAGLKRTGSPPSAPRASGTRNDHDKPPLLKSEIQPNLNGGLERAKANEDEDEEAYMKRMMGFGGFKSTKNTKVPGNQWYAVRKEKKTEYRQYMNRVGGFNRPLSPSR